MCPLTSPTWKSGGGAGDGPPGRLPTLQDVPPAPRRPSREARRLIFEYRGGQALLVWIGAGFLVVGLVMSTIVCWGLPVDIAIALSPVRTAGTIASAETNRGLKIGGRATTRVRYAYEFAGESFVGETDSLGVSPWQHGTIPVEHASFKPEWSRIAGGTYAPLGYLGVWVLVFPIIGAAAIAFAIRSNRREIRAFTRGHPVLARVTFRGLDESTSVNGRHPFMFRWEFRTDAGEVHEGSITSMKLLEIEPFGAAEEVVVLYDPADPRANTLFVP